MNKTHPDLKHDLNTYLPTVKVKRLADGVKCIINQSDFNSNPDLYEKLPLERVKPVRKKR